MIYFENQFLIYKINICVEGRIANYFYFIYHLIMHDDYQCISKMRKKINLKGLN